MIVYTYLVTDSKVGLWPPARRAGAHLERSLRLSSVAALFLSERQQTRVIILSETKGLN